MESERVIDVERVMVVEMQRRREEERGMPFYSGAGDHHDAEKPRQY